MEYATTYAVLDIRNHRWTEPALQLPTNMPVLGENPVATVYMNAVGQEYVVILSGTQQTIVSHFDFQLKLSLLRTPCDCPTIEE
jgi:hypothetical protein